MGDVEYWTDYLTSRSACMAIPPPARFQTLVVANQANNTGTPGPAGTFPSLVLSSVSRTNAHISCQRLRATTVLASSASDNQQVSK